jgi:hypothetical protein
MSDRDTTRNDGSVAAVPAGQDTSTHHLDQEPAAPAVAAGGDARLSSPRSDPETERRRMVAKEKSEFGGMRFWLGFFGWLTATGLTVLLLAVVAAVGALAGAQNTLLQNGQAAGIGGAIVLGVVLLVSYFAGGYVAGRMARFSGVKQGIAVWLWAIIVAVVLGIVGAIAGSQANIAGQLGSVPNLPLSPSALTTGGIIAALAVLIVTLIGAVLGGIAGMRFHRKVDRVGMDTSDRH